MRIRRSPIQRRGSSMVEFAIVSAVAILFIFGLIVGSMGVFRYQEVAHLAREGARYASTHGGQYTIDGIPGQSGVAAVSSSQDVSNYLNSRTTLLNASNLSVTASWSSPATVTPRNIPTYLDTTVVTVPPGGKVVQNYVTVTVTYTWYPELFFGASVTLTSTSTMPMSY